MFFDSSYIASESEIADKKNHVNNYKCLNSKHCFIWLMSVIRQVRKISVVSP
jgi:hypothetical protein